MKKAWKDILETFKARRHMVLYASLMTGKLMDCKKGVIEINYEEEYSFNKQRLEKDDNRRLVDEIFSDILKEKVKVKFKVEIKEKAKKTQEEILKETFGEDLVEIIDG